MTGFTKSIVEEAPRCWFDKLCYQTFHNPYIAMGKLGANRALYNDGVSDPMYGSLPWLTSDEVCLRTAESIMETVQ